MKEKKKNSLNVFIVVREYSLIKDKLLDEARSKGYENLSDYVRTFWSHIKL